MKEGINIYSKEGIKTRMLNNAASLWGLKTSQSLDPFVKLLIDGFSTEIFKVSNEVGNIKTRMLEKLARLLTPSLYTMPRPAHAIGNAMPVEATCMLYKNAEFFYKKNITSSSKTVPDAQIEMGFTPIDTVQLINARVATLITADNYFNIDGSLNKIPVAANTGMNLQANEMWIGIETDEEVLNQIDELCFYFSSPVNEHYDWVYSLLPYIKFSTGDGELTISQGLRYYNTGNVSGYEEIFNEYDASKKIENNIKNIYRQQFITITGLPENIGVNLATMPEGIPVTVTSPVKQLWIKAVFPPQYHAAILNDFNISLNSFPVINKKWKKNERKFDTAGNNIPLVTSLGEHFLFIDEVMDAAGKKYHEIPYSHSAAMQKGLYSIRLGGMERFDDRNALDLINYLLELTRDEVAAFGALDRDNVVFALKEMVTQMRFLERKARLQNSVTQQVPTYVIVESQKENEYIYAAYWVTHCRMANNIRSGTVMNDKKNTVVQKGELLLQTSTIGGEEQQRGVDALQAYRYALTTRDRLISTEDIRNFCRMELSDIITDVEVKKGTAVSVKPKEGFIRTSDIYITVKQSRQLGDEYLNARGKALLQQIEARSIDGINFRVYFLKK